MKIRFDARTAALYHARERNGTHFVLSSRAVDGRQFVARTCGHTRICFTFARSAHARFRACALPGGRKSRKATQEQMDGLLHTGKVLAEIKGVMAWKMV